MTPRRHFLPWDRPLPQQLVAWLAKGWAGPSPLDLSDTVVIVPTRQSGRRLREALAWFAAQAGSAVFPPRVLTPEALLAATGTEPPARLPTLLAWIELLRDLPLPDFREVFPVDPPDRGFSWALRLAEQLARLQRTLAENGLTLEDVPGRLPPDFPEADRWRELAELGRRHRTRLAAATSAPAAEPGAGLPGAPRRIVLAGTPDPLPASLAVLEQLARAGAGVEVVIFAPPADAADFDEWGRPRVDAWSRRILELPPVHTHLHPCADPADEARRLVDLLQRAGAVDGPVTAVAVGVVDPEVATLVEGEAGRAGITLFRPEGRPRRAGALFHLLKALGAGGAGRTFAEVQALLRCPDFIAYAQHRLGAAFSAAGCLRALDRLHRDHLPADLEGARRYANEGCAGALALVAELDAARVAADFPENVLALLREIFAARRLRRDQPEDEALEDAARAWTETARECAGAAAAFPGLKPAELWEIALRLFGDGLRAAEKPSTAVELQGWLELLFEDAPHLVVAGLNDGQVPESIGEDPFLPDSLRIRLGLRHNATRFARDAYVLQAIVAARREGGRWDGLLARASALGEPLRPSRLLLRCPDAELPARVDYLFRQLPPAGRDFAWRRAWQLVPPRVAPPATVAVTALRRWLSCPFRFYLQYVLRLEPVDAAKAELDAFDFGILCHGALEAMGRDPALRDCTDVATLRAFLVGELERHARERYGAELPLPLVIQLESARQRLLKFAEVQAAERAEGWVIQEVERPFETRVGTLTIRGKIDRIDRHERTGAVRVLDYKTSDSGTAPRDAHLRSVRSSETPPEWALWIDDGKARLWVDLQLPLYRHALAAEYGHELACGYVTLPKAVGETAVLMWPDYSPDLQAAALRCAEAVCAAIARGEFWPPNETLRAESDDFSALFHHGVADSVRWPPETPAAAGSDERPLARGAGVSRYPETKDNGAPG